MNNMTAMELFTEVTMEIFEEQEARNYGSYGEFIEESTYYGDYSQLKDDIEYMMMKRWNQLDEQGKELTTHYTDSLEIETENGDFITYRKALNTIKKQIWK